jgi:ligand-binding sensor domain-containing protein
MNDSGTGWPDLPALRRLDRDLPVLLAPEQASEEPAPPCHPGWRSYASQTDVRSITAGVGGELWAATAGGVLRWRAADRFTRYGSEHGLAGNASVGVVVDGAGVAWAISSGRVSWLDGDTWRACGLSADDGEPTTLAVDRSGSVWSGTAAGLVRVGGPGGRLGSCGPVGAGARMMFGDDYAVGEAPRAIAVVSDDVAWACSAQGLFCYEDGRWSRRLHQAGILTLDLGDDVLWLGTVTGPVRLDLHTDTVAGWDRGVTTALAIAKDGVWAASTGQIAFGADGDWRPAAGKPAGIVTALAPMPGGGACAGGSSGLVRIGIGGSAAWSTGAPPDLIGPAGSLGTLIQAVAIGRRDGDTIVWAGTPHGLFEYVSSSVTGWTQLGGRRVTDVRALASSRPGLWVGSGSRLTGLREVRDGSVGSAIMNEQVLALAVGQADGRCYAATADALFLAAGAGVAPAGRFGPVLAADALQPGACLRTIATGPDGTIWIGADVGLFAYSEVSGMTVVHNLVGTEVLAILAGQTAAGPLLIGTKRGLYAGPPDRLRPVLGFAGEVVSALAWHEDGCAWVGTHRGLAHVTCAPGQAPSGMAVADWRIASRMTACSSGLAADRVTSLATDGNGWLWIGTSAGLSSYRP